MGGKSRSHGYTLWELMIALTIAGIVLGLAVPSFMEFQRTNTMAAATNDLVTATLFARSEALKRQSLVTLCMSPNPAAEVPTCGVNPEGGFIVFVDENGNGVLTDATDGNGAVDAGERLLLRRTAPGGSIRVWSDTPHVTYGANGFPRQAAGPGSGARFLFCDDRGHRPSSDGSAARLVWIESSGRGAVRAEFELVGAAVAALNADCGL